MEFSERVKLLLKELETRLLEAREQKFSGSIILEINMNLGGITRPYEIVRREL